MPIIKSAIKRAKQAIVRRSRNLQVKRAVKQDITALQTAITENKTTEIPEKLAAAYSEIDRAVKKGTLHKNTAARRKSQLASQVAVATGEVKSEETKTTKGTGKKATTTKTTAKKTAATKATVKKPVAKKPAAKKAPAKKTTEK